jgi:UrcA family protein
MFASAQNFARNAVGAAGTLFFAGLCIAAATASPANAQTSYGVDASGHRVAQVRYADLDIGSPTGRATLEARVRIAARHVCVSDAAKPWAQSEEQRCMQGAMQATRDATMAAIAADKVGG